MKKTNTFQSPMELEWRHNLTFLHHSSLMNAICPEISMSICYRIINKNHQINLIIRVFCFDTIAGVGQCPQLQPCRATMKQLLTKDTNLNISLNFTFFLESLCIFSLSLFPNLPSFVHPSLCSSLRSLSLTKGNIMETLAGTPKIECGQRERKKQSLGERRRALERKTPVKR